jgi:hypothetical protein
MRELKDIIKYDISYFLKVGGELSKSMGLHTVPQVIKYMVAHEDYYVELYNKTNK